MNTRAEHPWLQYKRYISTLCLFGIIVTWLSWCMTITQESQAKETAVKIASSENFQYLSLAQEDSVWFSPLSNVYEGLVDFDADMRMTPKIASSWGNISDTLIEFHIRPNVLFHNGEKLTTDDVLASLEWHKQKTQSAVMQHFFANIETITTKNTENDSLIQIQLQKPDPSFLNKIARLWIFPKKELDAIPFAPNNFGLMDISHFPQGTGPYKIVKTSPDKILLKKETKSWSYQTILKTKEDENDFKISDKTYTYAEFVSIPEKFDRKRLFLSGKIDVLSSVPEDILELPQEIQDHFQFQIKNALETKFFVLNGSSPVFSDQKKRELFLQALDRKKIFKQLQSKHAHKTDQIVPSSILGFDPHYVFPFGDEQSPDRAEAQKALTKEPLRVKILFEEDLALFAQMLRYEMKKENVIIEIGYAHQDFAQKLTAGEYDAYFLWWKYHFGDINDIVNDLIHPETALYNPHGQLWGKDTATVSDLVNQYQEKTSFADQSRSARGLFAFLLDKGYIAPFLEEEKILALQKRNSYDGRQDGRIDLISLEKKD